MQNKFTQKAQKTLERAAIEAGALGHTYIGSEHLLLGISLEKDSIAARILFARGIGAAMVRASIIELVGEGERCRLSNDDMTPRAKKIIETSSGIAKKKGCTYIGTEHLLTALLLESGCVAVRIIERSGVPCSLLLDDLSAHQSSLSPSKKESSDNISEAEEKKKKSSALLSQYSVDITELAALGKLDPTVGREKETERMIQILSRRTKNNPCLIGEPGVGKTAVVEGLAKRIADKSVPLCLEGKRILCLDIPSMIAGAKYRGEFEDRLKGVMKEVSGRADVILFIDEMHVIVGAGAAEGAVDAANILKPALARGGIRLIGATTLAEYKKHIESDAALERRFQSVIIEEPSVAETVNILNGLRPKYEAHHRIKISDGAIGCAASLSARYINDRFLPDKAIDLIDEAAAKLSIERDASFPQITELRKQLADIKAQKNEYMLYQDFDKVAALRQTEHELAERLDTLNGTGRLRDEAELFTLEEHHVAELISEQTGVPVSRLPGDESADMLSIEDRLGERVIGQETAIRAVANAVRRGRVGLGEECRPIGSFLFLGKTGVGKTELARAVAEELFGSKKALIRFDMSEYMEKHSVSKLIGSPPGYVGYGEGGLLTEKVRRRPWSVVLFDEIEKAHADVCNILLQILEDGRLTDTQGRVVSFCNTVVIMTSNAGTAKTTHVTGFGDGNERAARQKERILSSLKDTFRPELLGRIDETVVFNDLDVEALTCIAAKRLTEVSARAAVLGFDISFDSTVARMIALKGLADGSGARNVRRMITRTVEDRLASEILLGNIKKSRSMTLCADEGELVITA
jgi:ATP-dependent Clp protease ATP-binding subunit ClpC